MRLYSLVGAIAHEDPEYGHFEAEADDGSFLFPDDVSDVLVTTGVKGRKLWETEDTRATRLHGQEMARRRDPASMLEVMEQNAALTRQLTEVMTQLAAIQLAGAAPVAAPLPAPVSEDSDAPAEADASVVSEDSGEPAPAAVPAPKAKPAAKSTAKAAS